MEILGIDIGGTGIKGAPVDLDKGILVAQRYRIATPKSATPEAVAGVVAEIVDHFSYKGAIGCTFPAVIHNGVARTAANVDDTWIGTNAEELFTRLIGSPVRLLNDADAAGMAEMSYGAGHGQKGIVMMITLGTGIGSAIFTDGRLMPNTELGHLKIHGKDAEKRAATRVRKDKKLSWKKWGKRVNQYLNVLEVLFSPDLFILGGGVSKKYAKFAPYLKTHAEVVPAQLRNEAGMIGAALYARDLASSINHAS